jgi:hypothetical protein
MGGWVKNVQLMALHPLEIIKYNIITSAMPLIHAAVRKMPNTIFCMILRRPMEEDADFAISLFDCSVSSSVVFKWENGKSSITLTLVFIVLYLK